MYKQFTLLFVFFSSLVITAQEMEKSNLYLGLGYPTHTDMDIRENNFLISLGYRHNFSRFFNWSVFLNRVTANSKLDFFNDKERVLALLNSSDSFGVGTNWSQIETYALGASLHFAFINKEKHFFSVSLGAGYYTSKSSRQFFEEITIESTFTPEGEFIESRITDFVGAEDVATKTEPFIVPALQYQYTLRNKYFIGTEVSFLLDQDSSAVTTNPVLANYYSVSLQFGKRF